MNKDLQTVLKKKEDEETNLFLIKGRITLKTYFFRFMFCLILYAFVWMTCKYYEQAGVEKVFGIDPERYCFFLKNIVLFLILIFLLIQRIKRMHDINKNGWYSVIPFYVFKSGTKGPNNYGVDPKVEFPQYFDQREDFERQITALLKKKKKRRFIYGSVLGAYLLIFLASFIRFNQSMPPEVAEETIEDDSIVTNDDILGKYTVKQLHYDDTKTEPMYADVESNDENTFDICLKSESGDQKITFSREGDETLYSEQLGTGTIKHYESLTTKRISLTFIDKNNVVWYFTK
ncbi:MAG: DUF805 domain-containing protein [Candidatus Azobacteroides sp.]|nr:DUF805 domain-containing protein [Candidatus Azobacteroides sp.]